VDAAVTFFSESLEMERELGIDRGVAQRHRRIGEALATAGRDSEATRHLELAREIFGGLGDEKDEAKVMVGLARLEARGGAIGSALRRLERARAVLAASGSMVYEADVLVGFADVAECDDDAPAVRRYLAEALQLYEQVGGPQVERVRSRLGRLRAHRAEVGEAPAAEHPRVSRDGGEFQPVGEDRGDAPGTVTDHARPGPGADGADGEPGKPRE